MISRCCSKLQLLLAAVLLLLSAAVAPAEAARGQSECPIKYQRHSIDDIRGGKQVPYLLGGIYDGNRDCPNCKAGGLWAEFCSFKPLGKSRFYDMQLCPSKTVQAVVQGALAQANAADLLTLTPCDLWPHLRGRTTWIIGDSMSKDLFKALRCFLVEFQDLNTFTATNNFTAMHFLQAIPGKGEPRCVHMTDNTRLCQIHAIEGDLFVAPKPDDDRTSVGGVLPLIQTHLAGKDDLFIVHFGLWHGETRQEGYKKYLHQLGQYYKSVKASFPHMYFMETPKQHFDSADGDYKVAWIKTRKGPWTCQPIQGVSLKPDGSLAAEPGNSVAQYVARGSWRNQHAREVLQQYGLPLLPIYNVTVPAWDLHRHNMQGQECSHFCHPSLPQFWLWHMLQAFKQQGLPAVKDPHTAPVPKAGCAVIRDWDESKYGFPKSQKGGDSGQESAKAAEQSRQQGFWEWLQGKAGGAVAVKDGVVLLPAAPGAGSGAGQAGGVSAWQVLQQLLDLKLLQAPQPRQQPQGAKADQGGQQQKQQRPRVQQEKGRAQREKGARPGQQPQPQPPKQQQQQQQQQGVVAAGKPARTAALQVEDRLVVRHRRKKQQQQGGGAPRPVAVQEQSRDD